MTRLIMAIVSLAIWCARTSEIDTQQPEKIQLEVSLSGDAPLGNRLVYEIKEKIRSSSRYVLNSGTGDRYCLSLIILDPEHGDLKGTQVIYSATLEYRTSKEYLSYYLTGSLGVCGESRIQGVAAG